MTLQDPNARLSPATTRRFRLRGLFLRFRRPRLAARDARTGPAGQAGPSARARARDLRRLAAIDRRLVAETPHLASMFTLFNRLTTGEGAAGIEQLPPPPPRTRLRAVHVAVLVTLAAVVALCFALSTQVHAVTRPCTAPVATSAGSSPVHTMSCSAYATNK